MSGSGQENSSGALFKLLVYLRRLHFPFPALTLLAQSPVIFCLERGIWTSAKGECFLAKVGC